MAPLTHLLTVLGLCLTLTAAAPSPTYSASAPPSHPTLLNFLGLAITNRPADLNPWHNLTFSRSLVAERLALRAPAPCSQGCIPNIALYTPGRAQISVARKQDALDVTSFGIRPNVTTLPEGYDAGKLSVVVRKTAAAKKGKKAVVKQVRLPLGAPPTYGLTKLDVTQGQPGYTGGRWRSLEWSVWYGKREIGFWIDDTAFTIWGAGYVEPENGWVTA
ncbi:hypothetical protein EDC01DRAFT_670059 [Geopyxis carbonaria]|nr:hypothetical protein EDC01DRAFT_670059 [Geopyxis carbonaria]